MYSILVIRASKKDEKLVELAAGKGETPRILRIIIAIGIGAVVASRTSGIAQEITTVMGVHMTSKAEKFSKKGLGSPFKSADN